MYCKNCGASVSGGVFCSNCGAQLTAPQQVSSVSRQGLTRSRAGRMIAGVCSGLNQYYGWDTTVVRIVFVVTAIFLFPLGLIAYAAAWVLVPEEPLLLPAGVPAAAPLQSTGSAESASAANSMSPPSPS